MSSTQEHVLGEREEVIGALERQLAATSRADRPHEYARLSYRLGLAYAESTGTQADGVRKALALYDAAAAIFDPRYDPVEHAMVLNAAGAAHRVLGTRDKAAELFEKSISLFEGGDRSDLLAIAQNNLGLVRSELGQLPEAVEAFDRALEHFDPSTADGRRARIAALQNRGQAKAAMGTAEALGDALADYEEANSGIDFDEAPYHFALVQHSIGVALSALATAQPEDSDQYLREAVGAFEECLSVFLRHTFPYQFALAKHNLGLAYSRLGGATNKRRALACFEDTVAMLDTRVHADAWRQGYASLEKVEKELAESHPGLSRSQHFAAALAAMRDEDRTKMLRERVLHLMALPDPRRTTALAELNRDIASQDEQRAKRIIADHLLIIVEQPADRQRVALNALWEGHKAIEDPELRASADRALDWAVGDALQGPQRILVRDFLSELGWERP